MSGEESCFGELIRIGRGDGPILRTIEVGRGNGTT